MMIYLSALVTLFSWVVKALNMSVFLQDVFGPMPTDWLFPDRSRLAKVVESWVKEGGGVAALRRSPPRSQTVAAPPPRQQQQDWEEARRKAEATNYVRTYIAHGACWCLLAFTCWRELLQAAPRPLHRAAGSRCPTAQRCAVGRPSR